MKILLTLFCLWAGYAGVNAQAAGGKDAAPSPAAVTPAALLMSEGEFDFGAIPQGKPVYHSFTVTNASKAPLQLTGVETTCGCTTPEWSKQAVLPGKTTTIKVGFNAATEGPFEKYITIRYNESGTQQVKIKGNVWKAPVGAAPPNASLQFIKQQIQ